MATTLPASRDAARLTAFTPLQELLQQLTTLSQTAKQAHGSVSGRSFLAVHALTEQIAESARVLADRVTRRAEALGNALDVRATSVARPASSLPAGPVGDAEAIVVLGAIVDVVARTARCSLDDLDEDDDAIAFGITAEVLEAVEKYRWMLCAKSG